MIAKTVVLLVIYALCIVQVRSGFSWSSLFFASDDDTTQEETPQEKKVKSQFELSSDQDRFILSNGEYFDLPELDRCLHAAVEKLSTSCKDAPEEELGKLTVWLYNCHAQSEGRTTFLCTKGMSLAECTSPMSESAWGTYQTISNRARAFCYKMSQDHFTKRVEISVNALASSANSQMQSMYELKSITDSVLGQLDVRNDEFKLQQEENTDNYEHLKSVHQEALTKVRERLSLDNDLFQQTFDRTISFNRLIHNMTNVFNTSILTQSLEIAQLSKSILLTHKQLLTFNTTLTRWFFNLAERINLQLSDIETQAAILVKSMELIHNNVMEKNSELLTTARLIHSTLREAEELNNKKGTHLTAIPDHLTLLFLILVLSLLFEQSKLMKFFVLCIVSISSAIYIRQPRPIYLSFSITMIPLMVFSEQAYLWLIMRKKKNVVQDTQRTDCTPHKTHHTTEFTPQQLHHPTRTQNYAPFTTNFQDHPIYELNERCDSREVSPTGSLSSSVSNSFGVRCAAVTRSGMRCRRGVSHGDHCNQHKRHTSELS